MCSMIRIHRQRESTILPPLHNISRDAEKRALAHAKIQKEKEVSELSKQASDNDSVKGGSIIGPSPSVLVDRRSPPKSDQPHRPTSSGRTIPHYSGSLIHSNKDPNRRDRANDRKRRKQKKMSDRLSESDSGVQTHTGLLPKVQAKPSSYQTPFPAASLSSRMTPQANGGLSSSTYLPNISQAFTKPAKPTKAPPPAKNSFGHYQLPSIDRRWGRIYRVIVIRNSV